MLFDQQLGHFLGAFGGLGVACGSANDRSFHQDVPGACERLGGAQAGFLGQLRDDHADVPEVLDAGSAGGVGGAQLEQYVDEGVGLEVFAMKPFIEQVEDRQQLFLRGVGAVPGFRLSGLALGLGLRDDRRSPKVRQASRSDKGGPLFNRRKWSTFQPALTPTTGQR